MLCVATLLPNILQQILHQLLLTFPVIIHHWPPLKQNFCPNIPNWHWRNHTMAYFKFIFLSLKNLEIAVDNNITCQFMYNVSNWKWIFQLVPFFQQHPLPLFPLVPSPPPSWRSPPREFYTCYNRIKWSFINYHPLPTFFLIFSCQE